MLKMFEPHLVLSKEHDGDYTLHAVTLTPNSCYSAGRARHGVPSNVRIVAEVESVLLELRTHEGPCLMVLTPVRHRLRNLKLGPAHGKTSVLAFVMLHHTGGPALSFTRVPSADHLARGSSNVALLFLCGSLPLFLGAEVVGGARTVRRTLVVAGLVVAGYLVFAAWPLAAVDPSLTHANLPGYAIATAYSSRGVAIAIGVGGAARDRKSTRLNSSHVSLSRMPSSA